MIVKALYSFIQPSRGELNGIPEEKEHIWISGAIKTQPGCCRLWEGIFSSSFYQDTEAFVFLSPQAGVEV